jgi:hypothetical protein
LVELRITLYDGYNLQFTATKHLFHSRQTAFQQPGCRLATGLVSVFGCNRFAQRTPGWLAVYNGMELLHHMISSTSPHPACQDTA